MSGTLRVHLLGNVEFEPPSGQPLRFSPLLESLLAFVVLHREHAVPRRLLIETFWSERTDANARQSLATALWRLRRRFHGSVANASGDADEHPFSIHLSPTFVRIEGACWVDVEQFREAMQVALRTPPDQATQQTVRALEAAVGVYGGDLLPGAEDDWVLRERERLQLMFEGLLAYLMRYHGIRGSADLAVNYGNLLLQQDPLREDAHRDLMRLYMRTGRRNLALRQFQRCQDALAAELGIPPADETRRVLAWVVGSDAPDANAVGDASVADLAAMLDAAIEAQRALRLVIEELQRRTAQPAEPEISRFEAAGRPTSLRDSSRHSSLDHSA